jgi:hypothetical protein
VESREFFDTIYAVWAKTTGAKESYWMPEAMDEGDVPSHLGGNYILAVDESEEKKHIASFLSDEDADFITAVHGCFPDLVRALHTAFDEADRKDYEKDELEGRIATLELEADEKERDVKALIAELSKKDALISVLESDLREVDLELHVLNARLQDLEGL